MTKRSQPVDGDRIREVGVEPALPPMLATIDPSIRPEALLFLLEHASSESSSLDKTARIVLRGFFFGEGQQHIRLQAILGEMRKAGINASQSTPKNKLGPALESFARYAATTSVADLLADRFVSERSGVASDESKGVDQASGKHLELLALAPQESRGVSGIATAAKKAVDFCGITAGGSVGTDSFRDALRAAKNIRFQFLLLDPESLAFQKRAEEEEEPPEAWKLTLSASLHRLQAYREKIGVDISVKVTSTYPTWRLMIVDDEKAYVNSYLPGKRGTESTQFVIPADLPELVNGFRSYFSSLWEAGTAVDLGAEGGPRFLRSSNT